MPQTQKMRSVEIEGVDQPFEVPADWNDFQVQGYLYAYRTKHPELFAKAKGIVKVPGIEQPFEVPLDWNDEQIAEYLNAYGAKHPEVLAERAKKAGIPPQAPSALAELPQRPATIGPAPPPGLFERGRRAVGSLLAGLPGITPETEAGKALGVAEMTQPAIEEARIRRNASILPEGTIPTIVGTLARGGQPGQAGPAYVAYLLHKQGLDTRPAEQWIRNGVLNSLWDLGDVADETVRGVTTPNNLALLAGMALLPEEGVPALIGRLTAAGFSLAQAKEAAAALQRSYEAHLKGDNVTAGKELSSSVVQAVFAVLAGVGSVKTPGREGVPKEGALESLPERSQPVRTLTVSEGRPSTSQVGQVTGTQVHDILRGGQKVAEVHVIPDDAGNLHVSWMGEPLRQGKGPLDLTAVSNQLGVAGVRQVLRDLKRIYPDAERVDYTREGGIAGRRAAAAGGVMESRSANLERMAGGRRLTPEEAREAAEPQMPTAEKRAIKGEESFAETVKGAYGQVANLISPASRTAASKATAGSLRETLAKIAADDEKTRDALAAYRAHFDRALRNDPKAGLNFIDRYERGEGTIGEGPAVDLARLWKRLQTQTWEEVKKREGMRTFIDNYFPHLFKDASQAAQLFSRRPLEGPRSWRYKRQFPTLKDALDYAREQGVALEPMYENPVDYMTAKLHEMNKYVHFYDFVEEMKNLGILQFSGDVRPPQGMARIEDPIGTVYGSPFENFTLREGFDRILFDQLNTFARSLGIDHIRKVKLRGGPAVWGYTIKGENKVWTKFAGPESVLTHELGHQLHFRYPELDALIKDKDTVEELRALADLRYEGTKPEDVSKYYKTYVRRGTEKIANLVHAYVHARERGRQVAPKTFERMDAIVEAHPELQPLRDINPSLVLGTAEEAQRLYVGRRIFGYYYAPEAAGRVINNYLKPGLAGSPLYQLARYPANVLNQLQLGTFSLFHMTFTGMDTATSMWSLGLQRLQQGKIISGLGALARGNIVTAPIETYVRGNRMLKQFYGRGDYGEFYRQSIDRLIQAGGRVRMEDFYFNSSVENFLRAWRRGQPGKAAINAVPAAIEALASPIMKQWVPRMKLGVFSLLAENELGRLGPDATLVEQRAALARAWDSTDNRLGQLVYDNLFWKRTFRDLGHLGIRSLGWTLGTFREIGGGYLDAGKFVATRGKSGMSSKMAYTLALPMVIALHGAMFQYLMTGQGPQEFLDYFYPQTGRTNPDGSPERIALPSYAKDEFSYLGGFRLGVERGLRQFGTTLAHKVNPELAIVLEMMRNRDFYGTKIRNEDDPVVKEFGDTMKYLIEQAEPFWLRNVEQRRKQEGEITPRNFVESLFGILPAPRSTTRSTAEALAAEYLAERLPEGARTAESAKAAQARGELIRQFRTHDPQMWKNLGEALKTGTIKESDRRDIIRAMRLTPLQLMVERLGLEQAMNVYDRANPNEKKQLQRVLRSKIHLLRDMPREKQEELRKKLDRIFGRPTETEEPEEDLLEPLPERPAPSLP